MYIVEGECDANYEEKIRQKFFYLELALGHLVARMFGWGATVMRREGVEKLQSNI
jgi:hypothetical protein